MRSANPALSARTFLDLPDTRGSEVMTVNGTVAKTGVLLILLTIAAAITWVLGGTALGTLLGFGGLFAGLILAIATTFKKTWAPVTAPLYAIAEGLALGLISAATNAAYPGVVLQAVGLTFGILFSLLVAYRTGLIAATENFKLGVVAATGGIAMIYLVSLGLRLFGLNMPFIHETGPIGIGFSLFVVVLAALNLVLDFDFIEKGAEHRAPKYMEWYGAFGLMVTLVWLYLEILSLLRKLNSRR